MIFVSFECAEAARECNSTIRWELLSFSEILEKHPATKTYFSWTGGGGRDPFEDSTTLENEASDCRSDVVASDELYLMKLRYESQFTYPRRVEVDPVDWARRAKVKNLEDWVFECRFRLPTKCRAF